VLNIDELKQYLLHVWHGIDQTTIDNITDKWHRRLWVCVCVGKRQLLWQYSAI